MNTQDAIEFYTFENDKHMFSGKSGKQRTRKEIAEHTNQSGDGHTRKIVDKIRRTEVNSRSKPTGSSQASPDRLQASEIISPSYTASITGKSIKEVVKAMSEQKPEDLQAIVEKAAETPLQGTVAESMPSAGEEELEALPSIIEPVPEPEPAIVEKAAETQLQGTVAESMPPAGEENLEDLPSIIEPVPEPKPAIVELKPQTQSQDTVAESMQSAEEEELGAPFTFNPSRLEAAMSAEEAIEYYTFEYDKHMFSGKSGKQRTRKEIAEHTNQSGDGHTRKIVDKIRRTEVNSRSKPTGSSQASPDRLQASEMISPSYTASTTGKSIKEVVKAMSEQKPEDLPAVASAETPLQGTVAESMPPAGEEELEAPPSIIEPVPEPEPAIVEQPPNKGSRIPIFNRRTDAESAAIHRRG